MKGKEEDVDAGGPSISILENRTNRPISSVQALVVEPSVDELVGLTYPPGFVSNPLFVW